MAILVRCPSCGALNKYEKYKKAGMCKVCGKWEQFSDIVDLEAVNKIGTLINIQTIEKKDNIKESDVNVVFSDLKKRMKIIDNIKTFMKVVYNEDYEESDVKNVLKDPYKVEEVIKFIYNPLMYFKKRMEEGKLTEVREKLYVLREFYDDGDFYEGYMLFLISIKKGLTDIAKKKGEEIIKQYVNNGYFYDAEQQKMEVEVLADIALKLLEIGYKSFAMEIGEYFLVNDIYYDEIEKMYKKLKEEGVESTNIIENKKMERKLKINEKYREEPIKTKNINEQTKRYVSPVRSEEKNINITIDTYEKKEEGGIGKGMMWMAFISLLLFWLPVLGQFIAGIVGGKKAGGLGKAIGAVFLPAIINGIIIFVGIGFISNIPILATIAGMGVLVLSLAHIGPLLLGAIIGGLMA